MTLKTVKTLHMMDCLIEHIKANTALFHKAWDIAPVIPQGRLLCTAYVTGSINLASCLEALREKHKYSPLQLAETVNSDRFFAEFRRLVPQARVSRLETFRALPRVNPIYYRFEANPNGNSIMTVECYEEMHRAITVWVQGPHWFGVDLCADIHTGRNVQAEFYKTLMTDPECAVSGDADAVFMGTELHETLLELYVTPDTRN